MSRYPLPSSDGTHHQREGIAIYAERFDAVLKYHAPGLAPVERAGAAWHIDLDGRAAYPRRFRRTFGFYEGRAAVVSATGWHHITPDGHDLYPQRYAWCGNYQGPRCPVRASDGRYHHLDLDGAPAYRARWRYAGDYRDGVAVVQDDAGLSTHIDLDGRPIHGQVFVDLDVFHKGLARARDGAGWTHVDRHGHPAYARRFAAVEPFYNGQARVERFDGALEVIDEAGDALVELRPPRHDAFAALSADLVGFWKTETMGAAVELGVFEALPASAGDVAARCALTPDSATRLLDALAELDLVTFVQERWQPTARGAMLRLDHPLTLADAAIEYRGPLSAHWRTLTDALRADRAWEPPSIFEDVAADPLRVTSHHRMLRSYARHDYEAVAAALALRGDEHVVDAGGGSGHLAAMVLDHCPGVEVTLLDHPEVVALAPQRARLTRVGADLFAPWPCAPDAVLLARVLHDWDDDAATRLLRRARAALRSDGRLFIIEMLRRPGEPNGALCSLHLLAVSGGRERTLEQYSALLDAAGFTVENVSPLPSLVSMVCARVRR